MITNDDYRQMCERLSNFPIHLSLQMLSPEQNALRVRGKAESVHQKLSITASTPEKAAQMTDELPAHLNAPQVWMIPRPRHQKFAWAAGYYHARKYCLPKEGEFQSAFTTVTLPCPYTTPEERQAFYTGTETYFSLVREHVILTRKQQQAALHVPMRTPEETAQPDIHPEAV